MPNIINNIEPPLGIIAQTGQVGDSADVQNRLVAQLVNWFGTDHKILDIVLQAYVVTGVFNYSQLAYDKLQMRLQTAYEDNLDLIATDYFGVDPGLPRRVGENDDTYRVRIKANLLLERATRRGMDNALYVLTGFHPVLFEPWRPLDCGGYNVADAPQTIGYSTHGSYGSGSYAYQGFIDVFISGFDSMGSYNGYNDTYFGYNAVGAPAIGWYGGESLETQLVKNRDVYQTINLTKVEGTVCWVKIHRI